MNEGLAVGMNEWRLTECCAKARTYRDMLGLRACLLFCIRVRLLIWKCTLELCYVCKSVDVTRLFLSRSVWFQPIVITQDHTCGLCIEWNDAEEMYRTCCVLFCAWCQSQSVGKEYEDHVLLWKQTKKHFRKCLPLALITIKTKLMHFPGIWSINASHSELFIR